MIGALLAAILLCLALSFFFSGSETAIISVNRFRLRGLRESGDAAAGRVLTMLANTPRLLMVVLICNNAVNVLMALFAKAAVENAWPELAQRRALALIPWGDLIGLAVLTPVVVVAAEILPKSIFRAHADRIVFYVRPVLNALEWLLWPIVSVLERFTRLVLSPVIEERTRALRNLTRQDMLELIAAEEPSAEPSADAGQRSDRPRAAATAREAALAGESTADERRMIHNIIRLQETLARDIMTPLVELVAVPLGRMDLEGFKTLARQSGYSRYPVYPDRIVNLIGYIDLYRVLREARPGSRLEDFVEPSHYVPETKRVDDLLQEFLKLGIKNAVVVDEYGGCRGWISREDILEEIVGELEDELDEPQRRIQPAPDGSWLFDGRVPIDEVNDVLDATFDDRDWDTIAGLVLAAMGRIPREGDSVSLPGGWRATVVAMDRHRIAQLRLVPERSGGEAGGNAGGDEKP